MSEGIGAWLLQLNDSRSVATSEQEVIEYLVHPQLFPIPFTPEHCSSIVQWRDRMLPVIDICPLFGDQPDDEAQGIVVLAYQQASKLEYLALAVSQPYGVWYPLILPGALATMLMLLFTTIIRLRYLQAEHRRLEAEEFRRG